MISCANVQTVFRLVFILLETVDMFFVKSVNPLWTWFTRRLKMNKDQVKGRIGQAEGQVKETAGKVVGSDNLEEKGKLQKAAGKVQSGFGDLKESLKNKR